MAEAIQGHSYEFCYLVWLGIEYEAQVPGVEKSMALWAKPEDEVSQQGMACGEKALLAHYLGLKPHIWGWRNTCNVVPYVHLTHCKSLVVCQVCGENMTNMDRYLRCSSLMLVREETLIIRLEGVVFGVH